LLRKDRRSPASRGSVTFAAGFDQDELDQVIDFLGREQSITAEGGHRIVARVGILVVTDAVTQRGFDAAERSVPKPHVIRQHGIAFRPASAGAVAGGAVVAECAFAHSEGELLEIHVGLDFRQRGRQEFRRSFRSLSVQLGDILRDEGPVGVSADAERVRHAGSRQRG
jgi:hypothetical protein